MPQRKDSGYYQKFIVHFSNLSQRDLQPSTRVTVHWGKGNNQAFGGLQDNGSELTLIPGDPNVTVAH